MRSILSLILLGLTPALFAELPMQPMTLKDLPAPAFVPDGGVFLRMGNRLVASGLSDGSNVLWTANADLDRWTPGTAPVPRQPAVARWDKVWFLAGGIRDGAITAETKIVDMVDGTPVFRPLPDLPKPVAGAAAAVIKNRLYVFGGATSLEPFVASDDFWILDLDNPVAWQPGPAFPGGPRAFVAATEQYDMLCLFGGFAGEALAETWVFRPVPLEGTNESGWRRMTDLPVPASGASALPMGQAQVFVIGAGDRPLLFHTLTDAWCAFNVSPNLKNPVAVRDGQKILVAGKDSGGNGALVGLEAPRNIRSLVWLDYGVIISYFVLLALIGFYFSSRQESSEEFALGNRKVRWWAAGISMFATGASAISFMAIPALAFATNLVWLFPLIVFIPAYFVTAHLIFPLLRRMEITSTYEYLERRFNRPLRLISSFQAILFQTIARTSVVLVLPALAISSVTGINVFWSVVLMGFITTLYTAIGGFEAVIWTEVFQAVLMLFVPIAMIVLCLTALPGGPSEFVSTGLAYNKFDFALFTWDVAVPAFWLLMLMQFVTVTVAVAGDQPVIQRVFSTPLKEVRRVNAMSTACGILIGVIVNVMGLAIFAYFRAHPEKFAPNAQTDQIVPMFVAQAMPVGMAGLVIAAIFAASMSTVASVMNSVATIFTEDFYRRLRPRAGDRERLLCLKTSSYLVGVIGTAFALVLAAQDLKSMMVLWSQLGALLGGGIVGVYSLGMFSRRANGFGAICGAVVSILVTIGVKLLTPLHWASYTPIAIMSCIIAGYLFSLLAPARKDLLGLTVFTPSPRQS